MIAERLDPCEVLEPDEAGRIHERLVDAEVVRVTVDVGDRLSEGNDFRAQREEEFLESIKVGGGGRRRRPRATE